MLKASRLLEIRFSLDASIDVTLIAEHLVTPKCIQDEIIRRGESFLEATSGGYIYHFHPLSN